MFVDEREDRASEQQARRTKPDTIHGTRAGNPDVAGPLENSIRQECRRGWSRTTPGKGNTAGGKQRRVRDVELVFS